MAERFEDLRVWQAGRELTREIYTVTNRGTFAKDFALKDQIRRAAISVMSNIAEGFESRTRPRFIDHLGIAKASAAEVRCQLYVALDQAYLDKDTFDTMTDTADKIGRQAYRLMKHLKQSTTPNRVRELPTQYLNR